MSKAYKLEVEDQLDLKIQVIRSNKGGDYYDKLSKSRRNLGPLTLFLQ